MRKNRISPDEKVRLVELWLSGDHSQQKCADMAGVSKTAFQHWVRSYNTFGPDCFSNTGNQKYTKELKAAAISEYLEGKTSQDEICRKYGITSIALLYKWIRTAQGRNRVDETLNRSRQTDFQERMEIVTWCMENGSDYTGAARKYSVSYNQVYYWVKRYRERGEEALKF